MIDIVIRKAQDEDLSELQALSRRTIDACYRSLLGDEGVDGYLASGASDEEIAKHLHHCDVAVQDSRLLGYVVYFDDLIHIMMVDVKQQGGGIGSLLLAHTEAALYANNQKPTLETFEDNTQAINFYLKNGWIVERQETDSDFGFVRVFLRKD